ncbi:MAG: pyruvate dehydrogenase complex E1 component subunit beta [Spirochaetae bacterium HGW-Spirochaetae-3]|jgi:pyruvate dehydrogenase E1 component beta subunit|nr:MAG: pyruvate dehydrogenase complex E1 component subunit beta [Spirochaetae bacterium HGW-Spirochaetae-3]
MAVISYREALNRAMDEEMARDPMVVLMGEEVAQYDGAYKVSRGLLGKYGPERVLDTPITELGFTGLGVGAAIAGVRPVVEWMTHNFALLALDQVVNEAAKLRHMSGGGLSVPIVFRGPNGPAEYLSSQHSQGLASYWAHVPGLKVVAPANPADAYGLLKSAIRDDDPVVVLESEMMYGDKGEVPDGEYLVQIGKASVVRSGSGISLVAFGRPVKYALEAAALLEKRGIDAEVVDLRSLRPLDEETVMASVRKTGRAVVVDESWPAASVGAYVAHRIATVCFDALDAPVGFVSSEDVPMPYNHALELAVQPSADKIVAAVLRALYLEE